MKRTCVMLLFLVASGSPAAALEPEDGAVFVRVVDVGAGLCCVVKMPGDHYMIYDAGYWQGSGEQATKDAIQELVPAGAEVDLLVLSHSDADHLGTVDWICDTYTVKKVLRSGHQRSTATWQAADQAIRLEREHDGCLDINLRYFEYPPGATYRFGDTFVTMVCGFHKPPADWGSLSQSEKRNAGSVVIRLLYKDKSILFTGDTVGRHIGDAANACIAAEKFMIDMSKVITIDSDVLIAPHHGADNGSSTAFIQAVSPEFVIFSAGHDYDHPRAAAAQRYRDQEVALAKMFRTDFGDDESDDGDDEWTHGRQAGTQDGPGDDDVDILIRSTGELVVGYRNPH